jgi:hypothetical protein
MPYAHPAPAQHMANQRFAGRPTMQQNPHGGGGRPRSGRVNWTPSNATIVGRGRGGRGRHDRGSYFWIGGAYPWYAGYPGYGYGPGGCYSIPYYPYVACPPYPSPYVYGGYPDYTAYRF